MFYICGFIFKHDILVYVFYRFYLNVSQVYLSLSSILFNFQFHNKIAHFDEKCIYVDTDFLECLSVPG
jgi:hypothetical protein